MEVGDVTSYNCFLLELWYRFSTNMSILRYPPTRRTTLEHSYTYTVSTQVQVDPPVSWYKHASVHSLLHFQRMCVTRLVMTMKTTWLTGSLGYPWPHTAMQQLCVSVVLHSEQLQKDREEKDKELWKNERFCIQFVYFYIMPIQL